MQPKLVDIDSFAGTLAGEVVATAIRLIPSPTPPSSSSRHPISSPTPPLVPLTPVKDSAYICVDLPDSETVVYTSKPELASTGIKLDDAAKTPVLRPLQITDDGGATYSSRSRLVEDHFAAERKRSLSDGKEKSIFKRTLKSLPSLGGSFTTPSLGSIISPLRLLQAFIYSAFVFHSI